MPILLSGCTRGTEMLTIDDAAILDRAKELCERSGIAWNLLSKTSRDMRVLTDQDRRECLMRARIELMRAAAVEALQAAPSPIEAATSDTGAKTAEPAAARHEAVAEAPARRVA